MAAKCKTILDYFIVYKGKSKGNLRKYLWLSQLLLHFDYSFACLLSDENILTKMRQSPRRQKFRGYKNFSVQLDSAVRTRLAKAVKRREPLPHKYIFIAVTVLTRVKHGARVLNRLLQSRH